MKNIFKLLISIFICQLAGIVGGFFTYDSLSQWYAFIKKPSFAPANWVFTVVWPVLFTMMGISAFLVYKKDLANPRIRDALGVFLLQLVLNILWSFSFFGCHSIRGAFFIIISLIIAIAWTIVRFYNISRASAALLIPYILWVGFASILNASILILNPKSF